MRFLLLVGVFVHRGPRNSSVVLQPEGGGAAEWEVRRRQMGSKLLTAAGRGG